MIEFESKIGSTNRLCVRAAAVVADAKRQSFDSVRVAYQRYRISLKNAGNVIFHDRNCIGDWWSAIVVCLLLASRGLAMSCKMLAVSLEKHVSVLKTYPELDVIGRATHDAAINILAIDQPTSPTWKKKIYKTADPKVVFNNRGAGVVALRDDDEFLVGDSEPAALVDDIADDAAAENAPEVPVARFLSAQLAAIACGARWHALQAPLCEKERQCRRRRREIELNNRRQNFLIIYITSALSLIRHKFGG